MHNYIRTCNSIHTYIRIYAHSLHLISIVKNTRMYTFMPTQLKHMLMT